MTKIRKQILSEIAKRPKPQKQSQGDLNLHSIFGSLVFNDAVMRERLPSNVYKALKQTTYERKPLDSKIANVVASSMKDWAVTNGATHYTHWFQPMTGSTAEKHDAFVSVTSEGNLLMSFSGKELIKGEPDASSFPSGGIRATFEARGYTAWDPTSPAFIRKTPYGSTLFIPTAFCSYTGEALDLKTPLLRSQEALSEKAVKLLHLMDYKDVSKVSTTAGIEQEYFLIDKMFFNHRPDLVSTGRTLFGKGPSKGQELEDHYFGTIPPRVLDFMMDVEQELYKLGIPIKTRHNEVAPSQYEIAPFFEDANIAIDHNLVLMDTMNSVADRHGFKILFHEKPFAGVNGSGKHCNWSMSDNNGTNLLDPGQDAKENMRFMVFLTAVIRAIHRYPKLLRAAVAHSGNDHRLGANEAPPAIISIFLGDELESVINSIIKDTGYEGKGSQSMALGVGTLPPLPKDNTDRNRTSPFAFTGNKFEFRALGSSQSTSAPNYFLNAAVTESIDYISEQLEKKLKDGVELKAAVNSIVKSLLTEHIAVVFNGNGYSEEWRVEAERRKLPNLKNTVEVIKEFDCQEHIDLLEKYRILSKAEVYSRKVVRTEKYVKTIEVEMRACLEIVSAQIIPAVFKYEMILADAAAKIKAVLGDDNSVEAEELRKISLLLKALITAKDELVKLEAGIPHDDIFEHSEYMSTKVIPCMAKIREISDKLEGVVDDEVWPLPKYREMLTIK